MAAKPESCGATAETLPPPYEVSTPNRENQRQRGLAMSGKWYMEDPQLETIRFVLCPDPSLCCQAQEWAALLFVKCSDVPRLMREGFHWDSNNVIHEDGYMIRDIGVGNKIFGRRDGQEWSDMRYYFLKDLQHPQRWTAILKIFALHYETLCHFDLSQLSQEKIHHGLALSQLGDHIYEFYYGQPQYCYNAIYNDMAMEGQWPWPRRDAEGKKQEEYHQLVMYR